MFTMPGKSEQGFSMGVHGSPVKSAEVHLSPGTLYIVRVQNRPVQISVQSGLLFITQEFDRQDYFLMPGDQLTLSKKGKAIIEAYSLSVFTNSGSDSH